MFARSRPAYATALPNLLPPRAVEYEILARATRQLLSASERREKDFPKLVSALHYNEMVWRTLAADVADDANALPTALRASLLSLYEFVQTHSAKVLRDKSGTDVLVDINTAVLRGLRGDGGAS
jgi:flagellar protein FlaF